ncbi:hypothetical protein ACU8V7_26615 [Zobellia nedashkovskayae]
MKQLRISLLALVLGATFSSFGQDETNEYLEFNNRKNVVHGVYLGLDLGVGEIDGEPSYTGGIKVAYVANQQFEVGFAGTFLYSQQDLFNNTLSRNETTHWCLWRSASRAYFL